MSSHLPKALLLLFFAGLFYTGTLAQTTIINPTGDGGFETGADFASNGWTVANGTVVNKWFVGTLAPGFTNRAAYISKDAAGAIWEYDIVAPGWVHFYRDVTLPAGETDVTLTFDWAAMGEVSGTGNWDVIMVSVAPTSFTPTASTANPGAVTLPSPAVTFAEFFNSATTQTANIKIPKALAGNCSAANTVRLIFTWKNDDNTGTQPPAGIDNISLVSQAPSSARITSAGGTFTIDQALPNSGSNFTTFTEAVEALNNGGCGPYTNPVTFNVAANQAFSEIVPPITASGSAGALITFKKNGTGSNPVVTRPDAGTLTTTTFAAQGDALITIQGADYVTFDGIDVTANDQAIEYGYFIRKGGASNGVKNVNIRNATVNMFKGSSVYVVGIYSSNLDANSPVNSVTGLTITSEEGINENIAISGMTVNNAYAGIVFRGFNAASPYTLYDRNNRIGVDSGNVVTEYGGGSATTYGIYTIYQQDLQVANNIITSATGTSTTLYGIFTTTASDANLDIFGNTVTIHGGGDTESIYAINNGAGASGTNNNVRIFNNTVTNSTYTTATSGSFYGIYQSTTPDTSHIYGNTVSNNTLSSSTTGVFYAIYQSGAVVSDSRIFNNTVAGNTKDAGTTGAFYNIYSSPGALAASEVFGNIVSNNTTTNTSSGIMYGIYQDEGGITNIYKNRVQGLTSNSAGGSVYGMAITGGDTNNVYNNIITDLNAPTTSATADAIRGISITATTANSNQNISYNTVFLNASSSGANFSTSGIYSSTSTTATSASTTLRNNNIVNLSTPNGTGRTSAYRRSSTTLTNYNTASNYNNYYAGTPSANNVIFFDGTNADQDLQAFKARVAPRESSSISENPPFVNATSQPYDLHISSATPTQLESGGRPVPGITDDIDGDARNATTPDIGAQEFAGIGVDLSAPVITHTPVAGNCSTADRVITATITDATGVPTIGALRPRIYYRRGNGSWFSQPGTLTSGTNKSGSWDFTIVAADLGTLAMGDTISYYLIAQDTAPAANLSSNPVGADATNVNTIANPPSQLHTYYIGGALSGNYNVGAGGTFSTLTHAVRTYNASTCINSPVTLTLTDADYSANETFPIVILDNPAATSVNTLTIRSASSLMAAINGVSGTSAAGLLRLDGADHVIIDSIAINVTGSQTTEFGYGIQLVNDADSNVIRRNMITATTSPATAGSTAFAGIVLNATTSTSPIAAGDSRSDYNTIADNTITGGYSGITLVANGTTDSIVGNKVINNTILEPYIYGIYLNGNWDALVEGNDVSRPTRTSVSTFYGVYLSTGNIGTKVSRNKFHDSFNGNTASTSASYGVYTTGSDGTAAMPNIFSNNWIYSFNNSGTQYGFYNSASDNAKYYYNSILLDGPATTSNIYDTYGFYQVTAANGIEYKNNIVVISRAAIGENYALYVSTATTQFVSDYNDYYVPTTSGTLNNIAFANGAAYTTLANWQASAGTPDAHSVSVDPMFVAATDLHLQSSSPLDDLGSPVPGVTVDIDGGSRDASTPDIGSDELPLTTGLDVKASGLASPSVNPGCYNNEPVIVTIKNNSTTAIDLAVNPVTVNVNVTGAATTNFSGTFSTGTIAAGETLNVTLPGTLNMTAAGTYIFDASTVLAGDLNNSNNAMPTATRTKVALTAGNPSTSRSSYCMTGGAPTLTTEGAVGYSNVQWQSSTTSGTGFTNVTGANDTIFTPSAAITQTMYYRMTATCGTNTITGDEVQVALNQPQLIDTTAAARCGAGQVTLSAIVSAGAQATWYSAATGGSPLYTGSSFTTTISSDTTFYVTASEGGTNSSVGPFDNTIGGGLGSSAPQYLIFDVIQPSTINSVDVFVNAAVGSSATIQITDNNGVVLHTISYTTTVTGGLRQTIPINVTLEPGTGYRMQQGVGISIFRNDEGAVYPYTSAGINITGHSFVTTGPDYYYWFYNWQVSTGCETARVPVAARIDDCPVPVTLVNFAGEKQGAINKLWWSTSTEVNNQGFVLQRSADGINFSDLGFVASKSEGGNSVSALSYVFEDAKPLAGTNYYRLNQLDKDGRSTYSGIVALKGEPATRLTITSVYPNPASHTLNTVVTSPQADKVTIAVTDLGGRIIRRQVVNTVAGDNKIQLPVASLASGTYLIKVFCNEGCENAMHKFIKQ